MGHKKGVYPMVLDDKSQIYKQFAASKINVHLTCLPDQDVDMFWENDYGLDDKGKKALLANSSTKSQFVIHTYPFIEPGDAYDYEATKERWQFLSRELQLKQEYTQRTVKDIKDKSDELKSQGKEILSLRKEINVIKQENTRLLHAMHTEEVIEREVEKRKMNSDKEPVNQMPVNELKNKMLKLAQAYNADRIRNIEFEQQVRMAYKDIELIPNLQKELDQMQADHKFKQQRLLELQEETAKEPSY